MQLGTLPSTLLLVGAFAAGTSFLILVSVVHWTVRDARARGSSSPWLWAGVAVATGVGLLVYLLYRSRIGERTRPYTRSERLALVLWVGAGIAYVVAAVLAPPDPFTQALWGALLAPVAVGGTYAVVRTRGPAVAPA